MQKIILSLLVFFMFSAAHAVTMTSMTKEQVAQTFNGKTLVTIPLSTIENKLVADSITIYFDQSGKATGHITVKQDNVSQDDQGKWQVKDDGALCITWEHWTSNQPFCDYVYNANNSVIFINGTGDFVSLALKRDIQLGNQMQTTPETTPAVAPETTTPAATVPTSTTNQY